MTICRYCEQAVAPDEAVPTVSYWKAVPFVAHPACRVAGYKREAYECQCLDADCNDCTFFTRSRMVGKEIWIGRCANAARQPQGHAKLDGESVHAFPNFSSGHPCFVHRRQQEYDG
jgi:hypothetical protein